MDASLRATSPTDGRRNVYPQNFSLADDVLRVYHPLLVMPNGQTVTKCPVPICGKLCTNKDPGTGLQTLKRHIHTAHNLPGITVAHKCRICNGEIMSRRPTLHQCLKNRQPPVTEVQVRGIGAYGCPDCDEVFTSRKGIQSHTLAVHTMNPRRAAAAAVLPRPNTGRAPRTRVSARPVETTPPSPTESSTPLATPQTPTELTPVPEAEEEEPPFQPDGERETSPSAPMEQHRAEEETSRSAITTEQNQADEEEATDLPLQFVARLREVQELAATEE